MRFILSQILVYGLPLLAAVLFAVSLVRYIRACRANRRAPGTYDRWQMTSRRVWLIVTSVILGSMLLIVLAFAALLMMAVAFM